ncbi:MAG: MFS transporter [Pseudomonadota bacterium]
MFRLKTTRDNAQQARESLLRRNGRNTLWLSFFQVFLLIMPIAVPFFERHGLGMQQIFALQAAFSAAVLLLEVPSGMIADLLGRRATLIWGSVFCGLGSTTLMVAHDFWGFLAFELLLAVSASLVSGADIAMAYDSELERNPEGDPPATVVGRLYAARTLSESVSAALLSVLLLWFAVSEVLLVQAMISWLPLVFALSLVEPQRPSSDESDVERSNMTPLFDSIKHLWGHSSVLRYCFLALCVWSLTTFYAVWLLQKLWSDQALELVHFGYLWAGLSLVTATAGRYAAQVEAALGTTLTLLIVGSLPVAGYLLLNGAGTLGALLAGVTFFAARGLGLVILRDALNRRTPSAFRATANSLASFGFRASFIVTGPFVGYAFDLWGMDQVLISLAGISTVIAVAILLPLALAARQQRADVRGNPV